jgi:Zn-dependent protease with chaperone function
MLMTQWLAAPWRLAVRAILGVSFGLVGRRQPPRLLAGVVVATVVVAIVQVEQRHNWPVVIVLGSLAVLGVLAPLADAAVSRRSERAADRFAVSAGAGRELACALAAISTHDVPSGFVRQLLARHPDEDERIEALRRAVAIAA